MPHNLIDDPLTHPVDLNALCLLSRSLGSLEEPSPVLLSRFRCQSVQLRHPRCLVFLSNSGGYFEFARSHGRLDIEQVA